MQFMYDCSENNGVLSRRDTSETVSAKCRITQIIAQRVSGSWAGNSKCHTS